MNYIIKAKRCSERVNEERISERLKSERKRSALTNYKKYVDISKVYGLTRSDLDDVNDKLRSQCDFLENSFVTNNDTGLRFCLKDCVISSNHNSKRYYSEIQNRINTLEREATRAGLTPVFLTLTLPSEFHPKKTTSSGQLINNPKYNGVEPQDAVKVLTKMFTKLRHDRSLKELSKKDRMFYRVNEPHKDGTPHTHVLLFIPSSRIDRVEKAFKHMFNQKANKFEKNIRSATSYIMKYINKTLPMSKDKLSENDEYLNAWYAKHRIYRFSASRSTAPIYLYRLLHNRFSLFALTQIKKGSSLKILVGIDDDKIMEIWDDEELLFMRQDCYTVQKYKGEAA